jgi:alkylated DNA repair dioxygenase AlkB
VLAHRIELARGAHLLYAEHFLTPERADVLVAALSTEVDWQQGYVSMFGKRIAEPRLTAWFSPFEYTYSGRTLSATAWPKFLRELGAEVERASGCSFNSVLANRYRDGNDGVGFHADDEPELGENPVVASVSLGKARRFVLRPKKKSDGSGIDLELGHGALLVMGGRCQHVYRHAVPKQPAIREERINLTFRQLYG